MYTNAIKQIILAFSLVAAALAQSPHISITAPSDGAVLTIGKSTTIVVKVDGALPSQVQAVWLAGDFVGNTDEWAKRAPDPGLAELSIPFNVIIPAESSPGRYRLAALMAMNDPSGTPIDGLPGTSIYVQLEPESIVRPILIEGSDGSPKVRLEFAGDVTSSFDLRDQNGVDITESTKLQNHSDNANVAVVDRTNGVRIRATGPGVTKVWFEDKAVDVEVVNAKRGDYNSDGLVNILDVQILERFTVDIVPEYQRARQPNDARDLNGDGTINAADVAVLRTLCDFPNCTIFAAPKAIKPLVGCVDPAGSANRAAYFGYRNENARAWPLPVGERNFVSPGTQNQGQPAWFEPGTVTRAFSVPFTGGTIVWTLKGPDGTQDTATVSGSSPVCGP